MYTVNKSQLFEEQDSAAVAVVTSDVLTLRTSKETCGVVNKFNSKFHQAMSRRKQHKPRHLDAEEGESGQIKLDCTADSGAKTMENSVKSEMNGEKSVGEHKQAVAQLSAEPVDMPNLYRHEAEKYFQQGLPQPTLPNHILINRCQMEPKRAVVSPLPRSQAETSVAQPLRAGGPRYFQSISCPDPVMTTTNGGPSQYSEDEDDDVPSDIESCANESELQEELDKQTEINTLPLNYSGENKNKQQLSPSPQQPISSPPTSPTVHKSQEKKEPDDISADENKCSGAESDLGNNSSGTVKLKALETTNVAVAQVVETDPTASSSPVDADTTTNSGSSLPNLQQVLFTLHQQQMFQLQVLQQIQHQVTKLAHTDEDGVTGSNGSVKQHPAAAAAAAAMFGMSWLGRGLASSLHQQRSDESCGVDDISETSLMSNDTQEEQALDINEDETEINDDEINHRDELSKLPMMERDLPDDMALTPSGSPDISPRSTPAKTPSSMGERIGDDYDEPFNHSSPISRNMPPLPYLGGLGHFMPGTGNPNPLLPSNMFNPHSMQAPLPGRFPIFRTPVLPRPEEEDPMEEFMEIDTSDTNKLEEFMKKMEPTLKDPNQCAICKKVLSCKSALQMHYRTHTGSRPFKCKICGRAFTTKGNLKTHMSVHRARHAGPPLHQCPVCAKKFNSVLHAQEHMRLHIGEIHQNGMPKPPVMPVLPQSFMPGMGYPLLPPALPQERRIAHSDYLNLSNSQHMKELNSSFEQKSPVANEISKVKRPPVDSVEELRQKRQKVDNIEPKPENTYLMSPPPVNNKEEDDKHNSNPDINPYSASLQALEESVKEMDKKMTSSSNFFIKTEISPPLDNKYIPREHSPERHGDKEGRKDAVQTSVITQAPQTSKSGNSPSLTSTHHSISNNQSPPSCPTSPFSSGRRQSLRHVCSVCHKPFSSSSALQIHMRTHTGERPFKCSVCDKAFTTKGNLKVHMSTHAVITGPPRRGRRMSMDNIPAFTNPGQFPPVAPRPPLHMFPGFPYPSLMNNMFLHPGKGLPFMPSMAMPSMPLLSPRKDDVGEKRESSVSPSDIKDYEKTSESKENNNIPSKGLHGELDLSTRSQAIKT